MLAALWLLAIGIATGLTARFIVGGKAYGPLGDALLGITGAFAVDWILGVRADTTMPWSNAALFTIWGAAVPTMLVDFFVKWQVARRPHGTFSGS